MCGIVAVIGNMLKADVSAFQDMLVFDAVRGFDSTGVFSVCGKDNYLVKMPVSPQDLMQTRGYKNATYKVPDILIGHNRAATVGSVTSANAHPFDVGGIVGVHNGTLTSWKDLKDADKFTVDSECMLHNFEVRGIEETWKTLRGAGASVWYDKNTGSTFFIRNKERPLYYAESDKCIYVASEGWMIRVGAGRNNIKIGEIVEVPVNTLFEVKAGKIVSHKELEVEPEKVVWAFGKKSEPFKQGELVVFEVSKIVQRANNSVVNVQCIAYKGKIPYEVSVWIDTGRKAGKDLVDRMDVSVNMFSGTVAYSTKDYTSIDSSTIKEIIDLPEDQDCCDACGMFFSKSSLKEVPIVGKLCEGCQRHF